MQTEYQIDTKASTKTDWPAVRGELSIYLLTIVSGIVAFAAWEDAQLRREEIAVVKQVHVQLDAYAHVTRDALRQLDSHRRKGMPYSEVPDEPSNRNSEPQP